MRRFFAVLLVSVGATLALAAPVPKHLMKEPALYYPTTVGTKLSYGGDYTLVVSRVEEREGKKVVTVVRDDAKRAVEEVVEVSETGLVLVSTRGLALDPPVLKLQAPYRVGTIWKIKDVGIEGTNTIAAIETVKVPAGTFEAVVRVDAKYTLRNRVFTHSTWYAPGVGMLKMTDGDDGDKVIWQLQSFAPAKP